MFGKKAIKNPKACERILRFVFEELVHKIRKKSEKSIGNYCLLSYSFVLSPYHLLLGFSFSILPIKSLTKAFSFDLVNIEMVILVVVIFSIQSRKLTSWHDHMWLIVSLLFFSVSNKLIVSLVGV